MGTVVSLILVVIILFFSIIKTNDKKFIDGLKDGDILSLFGTEDRLSVATVGSLLEKKYNKKVVSDSFLNERLTTLVSKGKLLAVHERRQIIGEARELKIRVFFLPPIVFHK